MPRHPRIYSSNYPAGLSRSQFRRLSHDEKLEIMIEWFHENFEDPANSTPYESAEGGYLWIWGGPFDASDELGSMFGDAASDKVLNEAVDQIQSDGIFEWAPVHRGDHSEFREDQGPLPPVSLSDFPDEPGSGYGSPEDHRSRESIIAKLRDLRSKLSAELPEGIGHNNPPEAINDTLQDFVRLRAVTQELEDEYSKNNPKISAIKAISTPIENIVHAGVQWVGGKFNLMLDEAAKTAGKLIPPAAVYYAHDIHIYQMIYSLYHSILSWLNIIT